MRVPKLCRNPDGRAYATIPGTKSREYFGRHGTPDADRRYREWLSRVVMLEDAAALQKNSDGMTVSQLVLAYLNHAESYYSAGEAFNVRVALKPVQEKFGSTLAAAFGPLSLTAVRDSMTAKLRLGVINGRVNRIRRMFRWGVAQQLLKPHVLQGLEAVESLKAGRTTAKDSRKIKPVPWINVAALLPFLAPTVSAMVRIQFYCGLRPAETCILRPCDVSRDGPIWVYRPSSHKNLWRGQDCIKAIPPIAQEVLAPFLDRDPTAFCFDPREADAWSRSKRKDSPRKTPRYPSEVRRLEKQKKARVGKPRAFSRQSYYRTVLYAFARAKKSGVTVPHWHPNQLRHSIATEIDKTLGRQAAQRWLGHAKPDTTALYIERQTAHLIELARQVQPLLLAATTLPPEPARD